MTLQEGDVRMDLMYEHIYLLVMQGVRLLKAEATVKAEIQAALTQLNAEKWAKVMKVMQDDGTTEKYPTPFLQKQHDKLVANGGLAAFETGSDGEASDVKKEGDADEEMEHGADEESGVTAE